MAKNSNNEKQPEGFLILSLPKKGSPRVLTPQELDEDEFDDISNDTYFFSYEKARSALSINKDHLDEGQFIIFPVSPTKSASHENLVITTRSGVFYGKDGLKKYDEFLKKEAEAKVKRLQKAVEKAKATLKGLNGHSSKMARA